MFRRIRRQFLRRVPQKRAMAPADAYDLWSTTYDGEGDNLLVALDEQMFAKLIQKVSLSGRSITDVGCGTGRHWKKIFGAAPVALEGYDVSTGMLAQLRRKYPNAIVHRASAECLACTPDATRDVVVSTLTLCHVEDSEAAIAEWGRILRPGGDVLLTDYHPAALGGRLPGDCSFRHEGRLLTVRVHHHPLDSITPMAARYGLQLNSLQEIVVDDSMRDHYESRNMTPLFERMRGIPLVYGLHFHKPSQS